MAFLCFFSNIRTVVPRHVTPDHVKRFWFFGNILTGSDEINNPDYAEFGRNKM